MTTIYEIKEPEPIILKGFERKNGVIVPKKMFFVKYDNFSGCMYLETGESFTLNGYMLKVIEELVEGTKKGLMYMSGKKLIYKSGSAKEYLCEMLWRFPNWRNFIETDGRGFYRLKLYANKTYEDYILQPVNDNKKVV